jgi:8-oxo-dGTP pyrophosphatase MutT (NUDIX family)
MGDGDGWVICSLNHRHWGVYGAAGILITDGSRSVLQHRAPWTHEGDTWALIGGARDSHEDVVSAALREAVEEAAIDSAVLRPVGLLIDDHGGWSYTSIIAAPLAPISPHAANAESSDIRWWTNPEIEALALHRGFAGMWPRLRTVPAHLTVIVNATSARAGALGQLDPLELRERAYALARGGIRAGDLPDVSHAEDLDVVLPEVVLLVDESNVVDNADTDGPVRAIWWRRAVRTQRRPSVAEPVALNAPTRVIAVGFTEPVPGLPADAVYVDGDWLLKHE